MKKLLTIVILIALAVAGFGCEPQRRPAPDPQDRLIPQESTIGYRQVDLDQAPAAIKRVASTMEGRQMMTWTYDDGNSYLLVNFNQNEHPVKVDQIIQRVPRPDFLWLHVKLVYDEEENNNRQELIVVRLDKTDKAIDGVGFEIRDGKEDEQGAEEKQAEQNRTPAAPTPARKPAPPAPVRPAPAVERDEPAPAPAPEEPAAPEPQNQVAPLGNNGNGANNR